MSTYTVKQGDTWVSIADTFSGGNAGSLAMVNPDADYGNLHVGQVVNLAPVPTFSYTIQPGDTLNALSPKFGVTLKALEFDNPGLNPADLAIGSQIQVPSGPSIHYIIQAGDMLTSIATEFATTLEGLLKVNNINLMEIQVGSEIAVPSENNLAAPAPPPSTYTVQARDTFTSISGALV
jgi:LysM repeat protein